LDNIRRSLDFAGKEDVYLLNTKFSRRPGEMKHMASKYFDREEIAQLGVNQESQGCGALFTLWKITKKRDFAALDDVVPPSKRTIDGAKLILEDLLKRQKTYELLEMKLSQLPPRLRVAPKRY